MLAGMAAIEQCVIKRVSFEDSVTYLLPFDPVAAKSSKAMGLGVTISGAATKPGGGVAVGKTGVELRYHEPKQFYALPKDQRTELLAWKETQPKFEGARKRKTDKSFNENKFKKSKIASMKKTNTLMEAMSDSHYAQMELVNIKLASMVGMGVIPGVPPPAAKVGAATGFHPGHYGPPPMFQQIDPFAVQTEKARVAALNFKSILKPAPKKADP